MANTIETKKRAKHNLGHSRRYADLIGSLTWPSSVNGQLGSSDFTPNAERPPTRRLSEIRSGDLIRLLLMRRAVSSLEPFGAGTIFFIEIV